MVLCNMLYYSIGNKPMSVRVLYYIISMRLQHKIDLGRPDNTYSGLNFLSDTTCSSGVIKLLSHCFLRERGAINQRKRYRLALQSAFQPH